MARSLMFPEHRRALAWVTPYWRRLAIVLAVSLASTALNLAQPYVAKLLIDEALMARNTRALALTAALMVVLALAGFGLNILSSYRYIQVSAAILFDMRLALYRHLQALSPRFWSRARLGDVISRLNSDIGEIQRVSAETALAMAASVLFLFGSAGIMLWLDWRLFLLSVALVPVSVAAAKQYQERLTGHARTMRERSASIGSFLIETLMGVRVVATSCAEPREVERFRAHNAGFVDAMLKMQMTSYLAGALPGAILTLSTASVFLYGGMRVIEGALSIGQLVAFLAYHVRLLSPVQNLMTLWTQLVTVRASLERVFQMLDAPVDVRENPAASPIGEVHGEIVFDRVSLSYDRAPVLDQLSFRISAGATCAIIGPSGAGKSTVADLMLRFLDPDSGAVRLDGRDIRDLRLADLRRSVAMVEQTPFLFHTTIAENIAYSHPAATRAEIISAARQAAIHDFIAALPEGYDTIVGERGLALSAGERQRIALARALVTQPAVLVLDEPTASLDSDSEDAIARALIAALRGRTLIVITHRPSLAAIASMVITVGSAQAVAAGEPVA